MTTSGSRVACWLNARGCGDCLSGDIQPTSVAARAVAIDDAVFGPPETMNISDLRTRVRCPGAVLAGKLVPLSSRTPPITTTRPIRRIYIQEPSEPFGIGVLLGPWTPWTPYPQVANKITVTGTLMPLGKETLLMSPKWTIRPRHLFLASTAAVQTDGCRRICSQSAGALCQGNVRSWASGSAFWQGQLARFRNRRRCISR